MFSFEYPWALILIFVFIACDKWCKERSDAIFFPHVSLFFLKKNNKTPILNILKWIGVTSAIIAIASPVLGTEADYKYLYIYPLFVAWLSLLFWIYFRNVKGI